MTAPIICINSTDEIRDYVNFTLCENCELQPGAFPMTERALRRGGRPCGVYFCLHGPRATQFTAIWDSDRNQILFYGGNGERFLKVQLVTQSGVSRSDRIAA